MKPHTFLFCNRMGCTALVLFFLSSGCSSPSPKGGDTNKQEISLDQLVPALIEKNNISGISIAAIHDSKIAYTKEFGMADIARNLPVTVNTQFQIGSVSKTVTTIAVLKLAEEGKIKLDDPVENYLKSWHLPKTGYDINKVTIRRILNQTAGLSVSGYRGIFKPGEQLPSLAESLNGYVGSGGPLEVVAEPGNFKYSSGGYTLLQLLVQDVTGAPFSKYVQEKLFDPLDMKSSTYQWSAELEKNAATPYNGRKYPWPQYQFAENASVSMYTTAADLAKLLISLFPNGQNKILKPESILQMIPPYDGTEDMYASLGCKVFSANAKQRIITSEGSIEGWRASYYIHPPTGDGIVLLSNSDAGNNVVDEIICGFFKKTQVDLSRLCNQ